MSSKSSVHQQVAEAYTQAISKNSKAGCCGAGGSEAAVSPKGVAAKLADYSPEELAGLPSEAVVNSFGCGNPLAFIGVREGDVVLDLGSGAGIDLLLAAEKVGPAGQVIGIDMTAAMLEKASETIAASGHKNVEVRKGIIEELPVESNSVDWVISNCVINLSPDKPRVFEEIHRVLKPGGQMSVSDIVVEDLPEWLRNNEVIYNSCIGGAISEPDYLNGLTAAGLCEAKVQDRVIYDATQLAALAESELPESVNASGCCGQDLYAQIKPIAASLEGKIWSAKIYARKPS
jgi:SAM-dependent methyltransferase